MRETTGWARGLLAGNGILLEYDVARFVADSEAIYSYEGTREITRSSSASRSPASPRSPGHSGAREAKSAASRDRALAARRAKDFLEATGINPGIKLSATETNSEQVKPL
jgi:hypothetical protein